MTVIEFDLRDEIAAAGYDVGSGTLICRYVNEFVVGEAVVTTVPFLVEIADGIGEADIYPTPAGNGLAVRMLPGTTLRGVHSRIVFVPDTEAVDFADLSELDPKTLGLVEPNAAWAVAVAEISERLDAIEGLDLTQGQARSPDGSYSLPAPTGVGFEFIIDADGLQDIQMNGVGL